MNFMGWHVIPTEVLRRVLEACAGEDPDTDEIFRQEIARREAEERQKQRAKLN
jgi:hypothetical protein